ncbi:hypothetical protein [Butyrivibrio sp. MB2005]|uniref:hypothetical protein n=1 Tax=Butyrivibrio sp. MB2005 TaxID=1280678 RepID=UPI0003F77756|nr:hypothetical protein [Butyrivibrio sp. MB2005]
MEYKGTIIETKRDNLLEWLRTELKSIPVTVSAEDECINIRFQELLVCGIEVLDESYKIFNATEDWKENTSYHCEQADDGTWYYYMESSDECISECKRLVMFEAKKGNDISSKEYSSAPLRDKFWQKRVRDIMGNYLVSEMSGEVKEHGKPEVRFEMRYDPKIAGPEHRLRVYLQNKNSKNPEVVSVWVGREIASEEFLRESLVTVKGDHPLGPRNDSLGHYKESNIKFKISENDRQRDIEEAFEFIRVIIKKKMG